MGYSLKEFKISIPEECIAQYPLKERHDSRLLVYDSTNDSLKDDFFRNIANYISPNDCVVYNDAKVINARLWGTKAGSGATLEILLTRKITENPKNTDWCALIRPARRVKKGISIITNNNLSLDVLEALGEGSFKVRFSKEVGYEDLSRIGEIPLPKYIKRKPDKKIDEIRYQTVYSEKYGAVASPTAGLHFTNEIVDALKERGTIFVPVTLWVDWGTFKPVREDDYRKHTIHSEEYEITETSAESINRCISERRRIVCVGTTSVRTVETAARVNGYVAAGKGETDLYIYPGYHFKITQAMITNFHMADSTLILLVAAFAGKKGIEKSYNHAVAKKYRFFSYGDAMLLYQ